MIGKINKPEAKKIWEKIDKILSQMAPPKPLLRNNPSTQKHLHSITGNLLN